MVNAFSRSITLTHLYGMFYDDDKDDDDDVVVVGECMEELHTSKHAIGNDGDAQHTPLWRVI